MKWTKKKPNKKGYYWYKSDLTEGNEILRVRPHDGGFFADNDEFQFGIDDSDDSEWWCYIPEPK